MGDALAFAQLAVASLVSYTPLARNPERVSDEASLHVYKVLPTPPPVLELGQLARTANAQRSSVGVAQQLQLDGS